MALFLTTFRVLRIVCKKQIEKYVRKRRRLVIMFDTFYLLEAKDTFL